MDRLHHGLSAEVTVDGFMHALQASPVGAGIAASPFWFPVIETAHVLALTTVAGTVAIVDFRLLGLPAHTAGVRRLTADVLPFTWIAFALAVISGSLLFSSAAVKYWADALFRLKMLTILLAGANMGFFHLITWRSVHLWDELLETPWAAKAAGLISLALWLGVIVLGRWVGFTTS